MVLNLQIRDTIMTLMANKETLGKRYEYKTIKLPSRSDREKWGEVLSTEGSQGWKLVDKWPWGALLGDSEIGLLERELPARKG